MGSSSEGRAHNLLNGYSQNDLRSTVRAQDSYYYVVEQYIPEEHSEGSR
jgi:hypothetical protein